MNDKIMFEERREEGKKTRKTSREESGSVKDREAKERGEGGVGRVVRQGSERMVSRREEIESGREGGRAGVYLK